LKENALGELEMEDDLAEKGAKATYSWSQSSGQLPTANQLMKLTFEEGF
jgi:hypothetical protein